METLDQVIFFAGLALFVIALFLFAFMVIEYFREKEKLLKVRARVTTDAEAAEGDDGVYASPPSRNSHSGSGSGGGSDMDAISNRVDASPNHGTGMRPFATSRPESGIFSIRLCGRGRMLSTEDPEPPPPSRWSQPPRVKELCSFTQPLDDLPPSYSESFRYPPVPVMVHQQVDMCP